MSANAKNKNRGRRVPVFSLHEGRSKNVARSKFYYRPMCLSHETFGKIVPFYLLDFCVFLLHKNNGDASIVYNGLLLLLRT